MHVHAIRELRADRLDSQLNATFEPLDTDRKARRPKQKATMTPTALTGEGHQGTGEAVGVLVARRQGGGHDDGVDDGGQDLDARLLADDDEGRGRGGVAALADGAEQLGGVLAHVEADDDDGDDVQAHDAVEDGLCGALHGLAGVVGLAGDDADGLDAAVGEGGLEAYHEANRGDLGRYGEAGE
ncbi:hypothetical protein VPNG_07318 [Cytospora leucostoma]|uniref:Uncharacterized protein n=1 Tax=Cytospora leucostoma TaxID=1230097 RepID=A0A423WUW8_9PEZI|nr:hypothetical protein VPNG_07318 [Cytospora leucostoma]